MGPVVGGIIVAPVMVPVAIVAVIVIVPVVMIPIIIVPVVRPPGTPVPGIISPVPVGSPHNVTGKINVSDQWPCSNIVIGGGYDVDIPGVGPAPISRIRRFCIIRFNDIIRSVQRFIPDQLDLYFSVTHFFNHE